MKIKYSLSCRNPGKSSYPLRPEKKKALQFPDRARTSTISSVRMVFLCRPQYSVVECPYEEIYMFFENRRKNHKYTYYT